MFPILMTFVTQYFLLFFFMVGFVLVDYGMMFIDIQIQNVLEKIDSLKEEKEIKMKLTARANKGSKVTNYQHLGYDFSGAAGHDVLVTDKIGSRFEKAIQK